MKANPVLSFFRSLRLTIALIISITVVIFLGVLIPQKDLLSKEAYNVWRVSKPGLVEFLEFFGFTDIYLSPITIALWVLFFINLITVMAYRIPATIRRCSEEAVPKSADSFLAGKSYVSVDERGIEDVREAAGRAGYRFFEQGGAFWAVKNRYSPLATALFHLSFLLLLVGGLLSFYTKFMGEAHVSVGETFHGNYIGYKKPKVGDVPRTVFTVVSVEPEYYERDVPLRLEVTLDTKKGRKVIGINRPYREGTLSFVVISLNIAAAFSLQDSNGNVLDGLAAKMKVLGGQMEIIDLGGYEFRVFFLTDYKEGLDEEAATRPERPQSLMQTPDVGQRFQKRQIVNPAYKLGVFKRGKMVTEGLLKPGEWLEFDDRRISVSAPVYWLNFYVVKEQGIGLIYAGFILMTLALIIRFYFYRRDIRGVARDGHVYISGRAEFYRALFQDEFDGIIRRVRSINQS